MSAGAQKNRTAVRRIKRCAVLFSGGLDSAVLVAWLLKSGYEVWPVYVQFGLAWEKAEKKWAARYLSAVATPRLRPLSVTALSLESAYEHNWSTTGRVPGRWSSDRAVFLPARNLLLVTQALLSLYSRGVRLLALGTLRGNPFPDAQPRYFRRLEQVLSASFGSKVALVVPLRRMRKSDLLRRARNLPLHLTFSCISPKGLRHCGRCNKCAERRRAFREAGLTTAAGTGSGAGIRRPS